MSNTKKVRWLIGGLSIPGVGKTEVGATTPSPILKDLANNLIKQGIAEDISTKRKDKPKEKGGDE